MKVKRKVLNELLFLFFSLVLLLAFIPALVFENKDVLAANITNGTVSTRVNITNTEPQLYAVQIQPDPIDLNPGTTVNITCNGSVFESNGFDDIRNVSATLYDVSFGSGGADDNNFRYTTTECRYNATHACDRLNGASNNASCLCFFQVEYYANNGSWQCNMTVNDIFLNSTNSSSSVQLNTAVGIDVPAVLDFGNLSVTEISSLIRHNVSNVGNVPINFSVRGFGGDVETNITRNLSMVCYNPGSINISPGFERFSTNEGPFTSMQNISNQSQSLNVTIPVREDDTTRGNSTNATFWRLEIPVGVSGFCNGTVIFNANDAT